MWKWVVLYLVLACGVAILTGKFIREGSRDDD